MVLRKRSALSLKMLFLLRLTVMCLFVFAPSCVFQVVYPFQEQYDLVVDHLKLLSDMRATNLQTTTAESESAEFVASSEERIAAAGETMEEEWSTCDEEEDEEI